VKALIVSSALMNSSDLLMNSWMVVGVLCADFGMKGFHGLNHPSACPLVSSPLVRVEPTLRHMDPWAGPVSLTINLAILVGKVEYMED
jgi:hypothetical protein